MIALFRHFASVGLATLASRLLGFVRDMLMAATLGTGVIADAFFVAFKLPNLFRRLFAEGAFNSAFVPLYAKELEQNGSGAAQSFAQDVFAGLLFFLLIFTAVAEVLTPALVWVQAPGFVNFPEKFDLTVVLTRICFPYLLCMSLVAMLSGVLNAHHRYFMAALIPVLLNIILCAALLAIQYLGYAQSRDAGIILSYAVALAGVAQLVAIMITIKRAGLGFKLVKPRLTPQVKRLVILGIPGLIAGGITQLNIMAGTIIASLEAGAVSYLYYADRIYQLPLGILGTGIGVVLLPELSRQLKAGNMTFALHTQNRSLEFAMALTLPAAVALMVAAQPIISVLYERGAFTSTDTLATATALAAFAAGLPAFVLNKVLSPAFFAREDTKTPMWFAGLSLAITVALSLGLFPLLKHVGIAVATTVAAWVNVILLWYTLRQRGDFVADPVLVTRLLRILLAAALMGGAVWGLMQISHSWLSPQQLLVYRAGALCGLVVAGLIVFFALCHVLRVVTLQDILAVMRRRKNKPLQDAEPPAI